MPGRYLSDPESARLSGGRVRSSGTVAWRVWIIPGRNQVAIKAARSRSRSSDTAADDA